MLSRGHRLPRNVSFKGAKKSSSRFFVLKIKDNNQKIDRFSIVVSKKTEKRAVLRNRARRQVASCIEKNMLKIKAGKDLLIVLNKNIIGQTTGEIYNDVLDSFKKEGLIK
ncbi:MAG: ribonuclease P protein component [Candidatus Levybacteria bacterium RIFCSPLOWO2_01_FULL_38_13]|nr:MAG: ribonuclease P protein component [Candidatus Levybacteria bacterium RIFCSPHIGHO2_01_FULL_41_15]OGH35780.1 MAG: ribonuclease P protein component [Candidatus Levybacteria bacterium RIFCSPLOWO2_01_FULL_38_13]